MEGNLVGSDEKNIRGDLTFRWLPGGFFLDSADGSTSPACRSTPLS
jgi:hypothetical protein